MKKKNKQLTAGLIILTVLAAALVLTELPKKKAPLKEVQVQKKKQLIEWKKENIVNITLTDREHEWSASRVEQTWDVPQLIGKEYESAKLERLVRNLSLITADQQIETDDPDEFGFAEPVQQVKIKLENGNEFSYTLGNKTVSGTGYYLKDNKSGNIYIIPSYVASALILDIDDLRKSSLLTFDPESFMSLTFKSSELNYTLTKNPPTGDPGTDMFPWILTGLYKNTQAARPEEAEAFTADIMQYLIKTGFTEDNASSLRTYGLYARDRAELTLKSTDNKEIVLYLGKTNENNEIYALLKGSNDVFTVDSTLLENLKPEGWLLIDHFLHIPYIDDVKEITFNYDAERVVLTLNPEYILNNVIIDEDKAKKIYQKIISLQLEGELEKGIKRDKKIQPVMTLVYSYNTDKDDDVLRFTSYNNDFYLVYRNDWARFLVGKYQMENLKKAL